MGTTENTAFHSVFYGEKVKDRGGRARKEQHLHGFCEMLAISLGKDKEGNVFPYYVCKNNARFYLKLPERK